MMPTHLYIKTHNITGLKYFGKTIKDPFKYSGSGSYWKNHIKKYGYDITTEIYGTYYNFETLQNDAIQFSLNNNIVKSKEWANQIIENGTHGAKEGHDGCKFSKEQREKTSKRVKTQWENIEYKQNLIQKHKDRWNDELRNKQSERLKTEFWTVDRKISHSEKMKGHIGSKKLKGIPKTEEHNLKNSLANKGIIKSEDHKRKLSINKQRNKGILIDHKNIKWEIHSDFLKCYNLSGHILKDFDKILTEKTCVKLGINYTPNLTLTKLGIILT